MVSPAVVGPSTPEAIRVHDRLLLILAPDSMSSEWVKTEIAKARRKEIRDRRRVLFPLRLCSFEVLRDWECFDADAARTRHGRFESTSSQTLVIGRNTTYTDRLSESWCGT
jgi:hypothetical protein